MSAFSRTRLPTPSAPDIDAAPPLITRLSVRNRLDLFQIHLAAVDRLDEETIVVERSTRDRRDSRKIDQRSHTFRPEDAVLIVIGPRVIVGHDLGEVDLDSRPNVKARPVNIRKLGDIECRPSARLSDPNLSVVSFGNWPVPVISTSVLVASSRSGNVQVTLPENAIRPEVNEVNWLIGSVPVPSNSRFTPCATQDRHFDRAAVASNQRRKHPLDKIVRRPIGVGRERVQSHATAYPVRA